MKHKDKTHVGKRDQTFSIKAPAAQYVQVVGDFTRWREQPVNLSKGDGGVWRTTVALEPGGHRYRFLVDGHWHDDPECTMRVPNAFGTEDSVRTA